jgi:hypothetical protein
MRPHCTIVVALVALAFGAPVPAHAKNWDVCGKGQVMWPDGGTYRPLVGARVYLMDEDYDFDDEIARGFTDSNGRFNLCGRGGDPKAWPVCDDTCSKPDPYVMVELENSEVTVENELGINRTFHTSTHDNTTGTIDFGTFASSGAGRDASALFAKAKQAYDYFTQQTGARIPSHGGRVRVLFPALLANGVPWTTEESIHWPGSYHDFSGVYHEFGHRIRHAKDGNYVHFLYDAVRFGYPRTHHSRLLTNEGFAFNEGWAHYFSSLLDAGDRETFSKWSAVSGGDSVEGNVAAKIVWLSDNCGGFKAMWPALGSRSIHSYKEFDAAVKARDPKCGAPVIVGTGPLAVYFTRTAVTLDKQNEAAAGTAAQTAGKMKAKVAVLRDRNKEAAKAGADAPLLKLAVLRGEKRIELLESVQAASARASAAVKAISPQTIADKSFAKNRVDARESFTREVVAAWRKKISDVRIGMAQTRGKAKAAEEKAYLDALEQRYKVIEGHLRTAAATGRLPVQLIPSELQDAAAEVK